MLRRGRGLKNIKQYWIKKVVGAQVTFKPLIWSRIYNVKIYPILTQYYLFYQIWKVFTFRFSLTWNRNCFNLLGRCMFFLLLNSYVSTKSRMETEKMEERENLDKEVVTNDYLLWPQKYIIYIICTSKSLGKHIEQHIYAH